MQVVNPNAIGRKSRTRVGLSGLDDMITTGTDQQEIRKTMKL
jgi:hypothetical protein